jgi:large subunit ribosomal protein L18
MDKVAKRVSARKQRHRRVRKKIKGTAQRPRLAVFRTARHIYVQAIDDEKGSTLAAVSTLDKDIRDNLDGYTGNKESAKVVGSKIAKQLLEQSISTVVFDRGGFLYHGRVRQLAEAARESGLSF